MNVAIKMKKIIFVFVLIYYVLQMVTETTGFFASAPLFWLRQVCIRCMYTATATFTLYISCKNIWYMNIKQPQSHTDKCKFIYIFDVCSLHMEERNEWNNIAYYWRSSGITTPFFHISFLCSCNNNLSAMIWARY